MQKRFSLQSLVLLVVMVGSLVTLWHRSRPWVRRVSVQGSHAVFSHAGDRIAMATESGKTVVLDAGSGRELMTLGAPSSSAVRAISFSADDTLLACVSRDGIVNVWDMKTRGKIVQMKYPHRAYDAALCQDGRRIAVAGYTSNAIVFDVWSGGVVARLPHGFWTQCIAYSPDGDRIATGGTDGHVNLWETSAYTKVTTIKGHLDWVTGVAFSSDGKRIVTTSKDRTALVWDVNTGDLETTLAGHGGEVVRAEFSGNAGQIMTASRDGTVRLWDSRTGTELLRLSILGEQITWADLSSDSMLLLTSSTDGLVCIWSHRSLERWHMLFLPETYVALLAAVSLLLSLCRDRRLCAKVVSAQRPSEQTK